MHEWALAEAVVEYLEEKRREEGWSSVKTLVLGLGELQNVDREVFEFALKHLLSQNRVKVGKIILHPVKASFKCRRCGGSWTLDDLNLDEDMREAIHFLPEAIYAFTSCPYCGSRDYYVEEGRGLVIEELEVE